MATSTVEDYLKRIYLEQQHAPPGQLVPMGRLAAAMAVVPGTATTMVKALADSGLVQYEPRGGTRLTRAGEQLALHVLRRHRLVELFLVKVLGLDWSEVHQEAEQLEHTISDKVLDRIDAMLERPRVDPHGDPIPPAKGRPAVDVQRPTLAECPVGTHLRIARILDQRPRFLQFLDRSGLMPGVAATVAQRDDLADALTIHPHARKPVTLGLAAAAKILVEAMQ